jgi:hypothetical protein
VIDVRDGLADTFTDPNAVDIPSAGVANDDHLGGGDMEKGQRQIAEVIIVIKVSRGWNNTAFERLQSPFRRPDAVSMRHDQLRTNSWPSGNNHSKDSVRARNVP